MLGVIWAPQPVQSPPLSFPQSMRRPGSGGSAVGDACGDIDVLVQGGRGCVMACKGWCLSEEKSFWAAPGQGCVLGVVYLKHSEHVCACAQGRDHG